ncbi:MAG TPA: PrgI family protein [Candidatus Saccharimonadales bacterium]|nr:PrgI family protein [Candidatus Saccharimonadales bacterium]
MQFKVPQNIDMEDKIIGPLTLTQFFYLLFGGLIIYILFNDLAPLSSFLFWILALPIGLFSFAMAFVKVQDRPFPSFMMAGIKFLTQPRARVWQRDLPTDEKFQAETNAKTARAKAEEKAAIPQKTFDTVKVNELANVLDQPKGTDGQK